MSIYTPLIEQTKKEIEDIRKDYIKHTSKTHLQIANQTIALRQNKLTTLQLAEKMHEEFVEKLLKHFTDAKNGGRISIFPSEYRELINRLSNIQETK